jgi:sulfur carrier protein
MHYGSIEKLPNYQITQLQILMTFIINGDTKELSPARPDLQALIEAMQLKGDRVAVELNGEIVPRSQWSETPVKDHDRLEVVHFVGGGAT